jgi:hypothetical protein
MEESDIKTRFTYHPPTSDQIDKYQFIREKARNFSEWLNLNCPDSRELYIAVEKLEEVVMWANASIARNGDT